MDRSKNNTSDQSFVHDMHIFIVSMQYARNTQTATILCSEQMY
jgi:hypothetical protein